MKESESKSLIVNLVLKDGVCVQNTLCFQKPTNSENGGGGGTNLDRSRPSRSGRDSSSTQQRR